MLKARWDCSSWLPSSRSGAANRCKFIFPSSIAAYGMPDLETKGKFPHVREWEWNYPTTMYGCNKLYCEMLGIYYSAAFPPVGGRTPGDAGFPRCCVSPV